MNDSIQKNIPEHILMNYILFYSLYTIIHNQRFYILYIDQFNGSFYLFHQRTVYLHSDTVKKNPNRQNIQSLYTILLPIFQDFYKTPALQF